MSEFDAKKAATDLVAAFVSNNSLPAADLPGLLTSVFTAVTLLEKAGSDDADAPVHTPAVSVRASTRDPNYIVSLITGEKLKTLKRHLARHGLTPVEYRERYKLPRDYPMVAPGYSAARRAVAERLGLGRRRGPAAAKPAEAAAAAPSTPRKTRAPKAAPAAASTAEAAPKRRRGRPAKVAPAE